MVKTTRILVARRIIHVGSNPTTTFIWGGYRGTGIPCKESSLGSIPSRSTNKVNALMKAQDDLVEVLYKLRQVVNIKG